MHLCPHEATMFFVTLPLVGAFFRWFIGCCRRCCGRRHKHK